MRLRLSMNDFHPQGEAKDVLILTRSLGELRYGCGQAREVDPPTGEIRTLNCGWYYHVRWRTCTGGGMSRLLLFKLFRKECFYKQG